MNNNLLQNDQSNLNPQEPLQDEVVLKFLRVLESVQIEELSCSETFARLDEFVETEVGARDADKIAPLIRDHLDMCPGCCEEYEALLAVLEHTQKNDG